MDEHTYFSDRLGNQINWYDQKSNTCQSWYKRLKIIENILALAIAPLGFYAHDCSFFQWLVILFGVFIAALSFLQSLQKYHENWIHYRTTCELLKHEKYLYLTKSGGYASSENPFNELVERCESIISSENVDWAQLHRIEVCTPDTHHSTGS